MDMTYIRTEVFELIALDRVYAQLRVGLDYGKPAGHYRVDLVSPHAPRHHPHFCNQFGIRFLSLMPWLNSVRQSRTEVLFAPSALLQDLYNAGLQLFDARHMVR